MSEIPSHQSQTKWRGMRGLQGMLPAVVVAILFFAIWESAVRFFEIPPILLPSPLKVIDFARKNFATLGWATIATGTAALLGLLGSILIGALVSLVFSQSRIIRTAFYPYVIFLQTVPIVAIAPLLITWTGYTLKTVVLITIIISLFPIISNVTAGLVAIDRNLESLLRIYQANRWHMMTKLRIPTAVAYLILGTRISGGLAVVGAILGDLFVGSGAEHQGLGTLMTQWGALQKTDALIAALAASTFLGVLFFVTINVTATLLLGRYTRLQTSQA